ncbi:hypothetical protein [Gracilinema caldarium]|uniref:Uncharacterized protein n=1 Tax=Gracilinema caldarium (strain ATCC 51460 / DSM 7334 / H1) TaxID=744872 RepID=F8EZS0_GRAC1|nr:hypothetical protein [Gracilinema caldarium]AEJ18433.1 hypothetical protein Spica_0266 [Gracilinema caldarium DSM 7334]
MKKYIAYLVKGLVFSVPVALMNFILFNCRDNLNELVWYLLGFVLVGGPIYSYLTEMLKKK